MVSVGTLTFFREDGIGRGKESFVFKGKHKGETEIAVKRVLKESVRLEADMLSQLHNHPNIVQFYATESDNDFIYLGIELCLDTLESYIKKKYTGPQLDITEPEILLQATYGLNYLHKNRIVHRDIKPQNILISKPDANGLLRIKLADFGISRAAREGNSDFTTSGELNGTLGWMAPEILSKQAERFTERVDIFVMGCVYCYTLTEGKHPFGDPISRNVNILAGKYALPIELNTYDNSRSLIEAMLRMVPETRPSSEQILSNNFFEVCRKEIREGAAR